jgi:hypothetical protein
MKINAGDKSFIRMVVGNKHVGVPDSEIHDEWMKRCAKAREKSTGDAPTAAYCKALADWAVRVHQENRGTYTAVMTGRFGGKKRVPL